MFGSLGWTAGFTSDLGDKTRRAARSMPQVGGSSIIRRCASRVHRGSKPLAIPGREDRSRRCVSFLNVKSDTDFVLVVAWALAFLRDRYPYPVIRCCRAEGSAKSTFSAILRSLLDPNTWPLRPCRARTATCSLPPVMATSGLRQCVRVCQRAFPTRCAVLATGGAAVRRLYTDRDEVLFDAARPVILNGIEEIVARLISPIGRCS